jgi:superfamily II DNA helicase RecQ
VPAYIVFSDATLKAMAEMRPQSEAALLRVPGVGPAKLERYGSEFLRALAE